MYNEKVKKEFIENNYANPKTKELMLYTFRRTAASEERDSVDLMNFDSSQIIDLLKTFGCRTIGSISKEFNIMKQYSQWAADNKLCKPNNVFINITRDDLYICINKDSGEDQYIKDRNELNEKFLPLICNPVDKAIVVLLYEGLTVAEVINLDTDNIDLDKREIRILGNGLRKLINIDQRSIDIIKSAIDQRVYELDNGKSKAKAPTRDLAKSKYIARPIIGFGDKINQNGFITKFSKMKTWTGKKFIKPKSIHFSGMVDKLKTIEMKQKRELSIGDYQDVLIKSGLNSNQASHLKIDYNYLNRKF